jgi:hypothetical protein
MLPKPSTTPWSEVATLKWDSGDGPIDEEKFHLLHTINTPPQLACLDEFEASIEWKGNMTSACKIALIRNGEI